MWYIVQGRNLLAVEHTEARAAAIVAYVRACWPSMDVAYCSREAWRAWWGILGGA